MVDREGKHNTAYLNCVKILCDRIDAIGFDVIGNEVKFDELEQLYDGYANLKYSESEALREIWANSFHNESLRGAMEQIHVAKIQFDENIAVYDPLKPRVLAGFTESLIKADLKHLHVMQKNETTGMYDGMFPYSPDVLMGYEG